MKNKFMKARGIFAVLLISVPLLALAACGGSSSLSGKYVIAGITDDPEGTTFAELDGMYKADDLKITDYCYIEFQDNGRFVIILFGDEEAKGAYTRDGNKLTLTAGGESSEALIKGKKITYAYETGAKLIFKKKPEGLSRAALIWIIAGSVAAAALAGFCVYRFVIKKKKTA